MQTYTWNVRVALKSNGKQPFRYEELRCIRTDRELVDHCLLEPPQIRCPQRNCTEKAQRSKIRAIRYVLRNIPKALALKSANGFLNIVLAAENAVAGANYPATRFIYVTWPSRAGCLAGITSYNRISCCEPVVRYVEANGVCWRRRSSSCGGRCNKRFISPPRVFSRS
jgi:hypothetical protein